MKHPVQPPDERQRLAALKRYHILDTDPEPAFDDLTKLASYVMGVPIALVSLIDESRQWFKSHHGLDATETPREVAFCAHVVGDGGMLVVPDAHADERFADNPLVTGEPRVRFYAGAPLETRDGFTLGTLCAIDHQPREATPEQLEMLRALAGQVISQMELRLQLQEMRALETLKSEFVSVVSHELRTPLTSIRGALRMVVGGVAGELPVKAASLIGIAERNTERLVRLVNDILDLQKIESGKLELRVSEHDLGVLLRETLGNLAGMAEPLGVRLSLDHQGPDVVQADRESMSIVLTNLISNAIKHSDPGGTVILRAQRDGDDVLLEVVDEGPGIAAVDQHRLFGRFQQLDSSDDRRRTGTGLGLAISKAIVEEHGGAIGVVSELGKGATFFVRLPSG